MYLVIGQLPLEGSDHKRLKVRLQRESSVFVIFGASGGKPMGGKSRINCTCEWGSSVKELKDE